MCYFYSIFSLFQLLLLTIFYLNEKLKGKTASKTILSCQLHRLGLKNEWIFSK